MGHKSRNNGGAMGIDFVTRGVDFTIENGTPLAAQVERGISFPSGSHSDKERELGAMAGPFQWALNESQMVAVGLPADTNPVEVGIMSPYAIYVKRIEQSGQYGACLFDAKTGVVLRGVLHSELETLSRMSDEDIE